MKLFAAGVAISALAALFALHIVGIDASRLNGSRGSVTYTDRSGNVLGTVLGADSSHSVRVPLASVSPTFVQAIIAAEDARFWRHGAVDVPALLRATRDFIIYGDSHSGGSTIEMQLVRSMAESPLSPFDSAQGDIKRKLWQIAMAERIAILSSKSAILEAYVNRIPMGGNLYGVEAAARSYFGEPASDLDLAQAALLAAIPNDPARLAPTESWRALRERQHFILGRMAALHEITRRQAETAFAETLHVRRHDFGISDAPQALFYLYRSSNTAPGRVRTTLDLSLQRFTQAQTQDVIAALQRYRVTDGAALIADNRTGAVLAYVGSPDYFSDASLGRNDGVQALRQPGSSLKPFTYELALERGTIASTTILADEPASYPIPGGKLYQPADYSGRFSGPVRVRYALGNSLNAPAVQVLSQLGPNALLERLHDLGFAHLTHPASYYGLGLTLGSGEVSLWELVAAYATIARGGRFVPLHLLADSSSAPARAVGVSSDWELIADILADPHARAKSFGMGSVLQMPFPAAVKTGTSSDFRDTWTVGFTRDYTVGVWVGNFDGSAMRGVSGVTGAGPLWNRIMLHLYDRTDEPSPFPAPHGFVRASICATTGRTLSALGADCPAIVQEWVRAGASHFSAARDAIAGLHIVFPHDGDVFVRNAVADALQVREQQIALHARNARGTIHWSVDGNAIHPDASDTAFFPLRVGTWHIEATDGLTRDRVNIRVVPPPQRGEVGFTVLKSR